MPLLMAHALATSLAPLENCPHSTSFRRGTMNIFGDCKNTTEFLPILATSAPYFSGKLSTTNQRGEDEEKRRNLPAGACSVARQSASWASSFAIPSPVLFHDADGRGNGSLWTAQRRGWMRTLLLPRRGQVARFGQR
jgi:hypothetical protein